MRTKRTTRATGAAAAALLLVLAGCGGGDQQRPQGQQPAKSLAPASPGGTGVATAQATADSIASPTTPTPLPSSTSWAFPPGGPQPTLPAVADPAAAVLRTRCKDLRLAATGPVERVSDGRTAAPGQRLVGLRLQVAEKQTCAQSDPDLLSGPSAAVVAGDTEVSVELDPDETSEQSALVSVPDVPDVSLAVAGSPQRLDLQTGRVTGEAPAALLRDGLKAAAGVGVARTLSYTVDYGFKVPTKRAERLELTLGTAVLRSAVSVDGQEVSARPDRLVLAAVVQQSGSGSALVPAERWRLAYDGAPAGGARVLVPSEPGFGTGRLELAFDVPADVTRATLTAAPGRQVQGTSTNDFGRATASFVLRFPTG